MFLLQMDSDRFATLLAEDHPPLINIGVGEDVTIRGLAELICRLLDYDGDLIFDASQPDGTPRKLLDVSRMRALGWSAKVSLEEGIRRTYAAVGEQLLSASK